MMPAIIISCGHVDDDKPADVAAEDPRVTFVDVAARMGVADAGLSAGCAWGDYDGDGDMDLYLVNDGGANRLFRNMGGQFKDVAQVQGVDHTGLGRGAAWADFDNDGDLDLYVTNLGADVLYRNDGTGFTDVTTASGIRNNLEATGPVWGDFNRDGFVDLYVPVRGAGNRLFQNNGGLFTDVASMQGVDVGFTSESAMWFDADMDGDEDLFVSNSDAGNFFFRNTGGQFEDRTSSSNLAVTSLSFGSAAGDFDNDADFDIYLGNDDGSNQLFRKGSGLVYTDEARALHVGDTGGQGRSVAWGDVDNDGDLDLFVANHQTLSRLFLNMVNESAGVFMDVTTDGGIRIAGDAVGAAFCDFDDDGDLDLYVCLRDERNRLYENRTTDKGRFLKVVLVGTQSNRSAIGTVVTVSDQGARQIRQLSGGMGFCSQPSMALHFGVGRSATVDQVRVDWPSGAVTILKDVGTNRTVIIRE